MNNRLHRFQLATAAYCLTCVIVAVAIVLRGNGPRPTVVALYPSNGDRYWPGGTAQITFSQSMDQSSVERALQVTPGSQGQGIWYDNTLNLQPVGDWKPDTTYHLVLRGSVLDDQGRALRTPVEFWFRVHHVGKLALCAVRSVTNVCEAIGSSWRAITSSPTPVSSFALSPDGSIVAYIRRDATGLPHLFEIGVDGTDARQLSTGRLYADSRPTWLPGDSSTITYRRRPLTVTSGHSQPGAEQIWTVQIDGSANSRLS